MYACFNECAQLGTSATRSNELVGLPLSIDTPRILFCDSSTAGCMGVRPRPRTGSAKQVQGPVQGLEAVMRLTKNRSKEPW